MIIVTGGEKGGVSKTTLAWNLALMRLHAGRNVLVVDSDPQGSFSRLQDIRDANGHTPRLTVVQKTGRTIAHDVLALAGHYDDVVIDTGGRAGTELQSALIAADLLVLPVQPSTLDLLTLERMDTLVGDTMLRRPDLCVMMLLTRAPPNPLVTEVAETVAAVTAAQFMYLPLAMLPLTGGGKGGSQEPLIVCERIVYRKTIRTGQSVPEYVADLTRTNPKGATTLRPAVNEMLTLYRAVFAEDYAHAAEAHPTPDAVAAIEDAGRTGTAA